MRYLSIYKTVETNVPPTPDHMARMEKLIDDMTKAGKLIATGAACRALSARASGAREES